MNKGQKILKSAKKIIPGGNQLLSKRSEMFAPNVWPNYFSKAKGEEVKITIRIFFFEINSSIIPVFKKFRTVIPFGNKKKMVLFFIIKSTRFMLLPFL